MAEEPEVHVLHMQEAHSEPAGQLDKVMASMGGHLAGDTVVDSVQSMANDSDSLVGIGAVGHWEGAGCSNLL